MNATESLAAGICPNCVSSAMEIKADYIACRTCGIHGNPAEMKWCEKVPVFREVAKENVWQAAGQLYKHEDRMFTLYGYVPGCGRVMERGWCPSCQRFLPAPVERPTRKAKRKSGKDAAAGETDEEVAV